MFKWGPKMVPQVTAGFPMNNDYGRLDGAHRYHGDKENPWFVGFIAYLRGFIAYIIGFIAYLIGFDKHDDVPVKHHFSLEKPAEALAGSTSGGRSAGGSPVRGKGGHPGLQLMVVKGSDGSSVYGETVDEHHRL